MRDVVEAFCALWEGDRAESCRPPPQLFVTGQALPPMSSHRPTSCRRTRWFSSLISPDPAGIPPSLELDPKLLSLQPALRADVADAASCLYSARSAPLAVPITVFAGSQDAWSGEDLMGWSAHTNNVFSLHLFREGISSRQGRG